MNLEAGPLSGSFLRYEIPKAAFDINPFRWDSTDATTSGLIPAKLTRWPNSAIKADCWDSIGASKINVGGGYLEVSAFTDYVNILLDYCE